MKQYLVTGMCSMLSFLTYAQQKDTVQTKPQNQVYLNSASRLLAMDGRLKIGGYGEVHYNQQLKQNNNRYNAELDVHRMVMLFGYSFNNRTQFITELEYEHVKEIYVEQAFIDYRLNRFANLRAGLMLIPMGLINEYHEPVAFNGVERPQIDGYIAPTTWREIGIGFTGNIIDASLNYQLYLVNGFKSYDGSQSAGSEGLIKGSNGLRSGRQKGAESIMSSPNFAAKVSYYGIRGLNLGLSGYFGKTQSTLYDGLDTSDDVATAKADSSVVGIAMVGADVRYSFRNWRLRGQFYYAGLSNTQEYNTLTSQDLGNSLMGYYVEAGYNIIRLLKKNPDQGEEFIPFVRYSELDTHNTVDGITKNDAYFRRYITSGFSWKVAPGAVFKADIQLANSKADNSYTKTINAGFGVMF